MSYFELVVCITGLVLWISSVLTTKVSKLIYGTYGTNTALVKGAGLGCLLGAVGLTGLIGAYVGQEARFWPNLISAWIVVIALALDALEARFNRRRCLRFPDLVGKAQYTILVNKTKFEVTIAWVGLGWLLYVILK